MGSPWSAVWWIHSWSFDKLPNRQGRKLVDQALKVALEFWRVGEHHRADGECGQAS